MNRTLGEIAAAHLVKNGARADGAALREVSELADAYAEALDAKKRAERLANEAEENLDRLAGVAGPFWAAFAVSERSAVCGRITAAVRVSAWFTSSEAAEACRGLLIDHEDGPLFVATCRTDAVALYREQWKIERERDISGDWAGRDRGKQ